MKRKLFVTLLFLLGLVAFRTAHAQIVDDSTKMLYSPKTTLQLYENDVLEGRYKEERIDTTIQNFQNERYWYHDTTYYQTLGNVGTASQPLLYRVPNTIGVRYGRNAFDRYAYDPNDINYFDTRSPYTHLFYIQGGQGEQLFEAMHARNITPRWNFGVAYQLLAAQKQLNTNNVGSRGRDRLVDQSGAKIFTHYRSENEKYDLFFNYTLLHQEQIEQGGVLLPSATTPRDSLFEYETQTVNLNQAVTQEKRNHFHLLHIYRLAKENLKVYHKLDAHIQEDEYIDDDIPRVVTGTDTTVLFYPQARHSKVKTRDIAKYQELQNVFGLSGNNKLSSYTAYAKFRNAKADFSTVSRFASKDTAVTEAEERADKAYNQLFVGGQLRLFYENKAELAVDGEFQLSQDYRLRGVARLAGLQASLERVLYSPTVTEEYVLSNHFYWNSDFKSSVADHGEVNYSGKLGGRQYVKLNATYTNIKRYIFYNENARPEQLQGNQRLWGAQLTHQIRFGGFHFDNFVSYTNTDEASKVRVPEWLLDSKLYFQGDLFKKALYGQFGVEAYIPSGFYADAYMPVTQQFYLQNNFELNTYPMLDLFITADIKTVNVFLKMSNITDGVWQPGYFTTPYYPGMRRSFMFGVKWMFFD